MCMMVIMCAACHGKSMHTRLGATETMLLEFPDARQRFGMDRVIQARGDVHDGEIFASLIPGKYITF